MTSLAADRYIVISSDGHAGAEMLDYRGYLERRYLEEFDAWAKTYADPYADLQGETAYRNWDSAARLGELEDDGVVAEVLFPNTIPPFFPSAQPPGAAHRPRRRTSSGGRACGRTTGGWPSSVPTLRVGVPAWPRSS